MEGWRVLNSTGVETGVTTSPEYSEFEVPLIEYYP